MRTLWIVCCAVVLTAAACREAEELPNPYTDGGFFVVIEDAGPIPDGAIGAPCPTEGCHPALVAVAEADGGCVCRRPCAPADPLPRCVDWEICAQLRQQLPDGGSSLLDAGVCLPAGAPGSGCSPEPCAELLMCARLSNQDAGNTCRYPCTPGADAAIEDATGAELVPTMGECPPAQQCFGMGNDAGACFVP